MKKLKVLDFILLGIGAIFSFICITEDGSGTLDYRRNRDCILTLFLITLFYFVVQNCC